MVSRFICKFAVSFRKFLCVTFHVIGPRRYCFCNIVADLTLFECNSKFLGQEMMLVLPDQRLP